jgi:DNA-binding MarR family transcriptional regulator
VDPAERAGYLLWQTAHVFGLEMGAALEPFDLSPAQFGALTHVGREPGVSAAELARRLLLTPQSLQSALTPLRDRALIERRSHPVHGRVLGNFLTDCGMRLAEQTSTVVAAVDEQMLRDFTADEANHFRGYIRRAMLTLSPTALDRTSIRVK